MQPIVDGVDSEMKAQDTDDLTPIDLEHYRSLVRTFIDLRRYKTALFWAEKVAVLSGNQPKDIFWMAHCMFLLHEYHRAAHIIKTHHLERTNIYCHHLIVECYYEAKELTEAMNLLNSIDLEYLSNSVINKDDTNIDDTILQILAVVDMDEIGPTKSEVLSAIYLLKGKILEAMDNRNMAMNCYIEALHLDIYCTEALDALIQHEMLLASEERELISHLPFDTQCTNGERKVIEKLYRSKLKKYNESLLTTPTNLSKMATPNFDSVGTIRAILEFTEKTKTERSNSEVKLTASKSTSSKLVAPSLYNVATPSPTEISSAMFLHRSKVETPPTPLHGTTNFTSHQTFKMPGSQNKHSRKVPNKQTDAKTLIPAQIACIRLNQSVDLINERAGNLFYSSEYKRCVNVLDEILRNDPYFCPALIILIGCLVELKEYSELFSVAHKLVDLYSDQAISWYAVGCYYDLIGKSDPARRYLSKATSIDRLFGPAWLAYGHSFAKENEHDQAMAAYFKATQLMRGCHLPLLYIGVECGLTKNYDLSQKFFYQAMSIAPLDVFVLHELGVIKFEYEYYEEAEEIFRVTLNMITKISLENKEPIAVRWEPLVNNLGHCCRKNKKYDEAMKYHKQALSLKPLNPATYTAIGFVHALQGQLERAVEYLHRSLALKRDDIVTTALLKSCLEDLMSSEALPKNLNEDPESVAKRDSKANLYGNEATKVKGMKITFEDDSSHSQGADMIDLDMSMDV